VLAPNPGQKLGLDEDVVKDDDGEYEKIRELVGRGCGGERNGHIPDVV
jgi:hypothetical protein